ncbi:MAG: acyltransferase [Nitrospira sp.]
MKEMGSPVAHDNIRSLTGVRGFAALIVLCYHFFEGFPSFASSIFHRGYLAVDMFFVLSGFVLALSYAQKFRAPVHPLATYFYFILNRLGRIYPLLVVALLFTFLRLQLDFTGNMQKLYPGFGVLSLTENLLLIQAWGFGIRAMPLQSWSLSAEWFAYLLFPALVYMIFHRRALFPTLAAIAALVWWFNCEVSGEGYIGAMDIAGGDGPFPLVRCLSGFTLGMVGYWMISNGYVPRAVGHKWVTLGLLVTLPIAAYVGMPDVVLALWFPVIVVSLYYENVIGKSIFGNRLSHWIGEISYSIYIIHPLIVSACTRLAKLLADWYGEVGTVLAFCVYVTITVVVSAASYRLIEVRGRQFTKTLSERVGLKAIALASHRG